MDGARIGFLEAKPIDWTRIRALLAESERLNHWANFGPVAQRLESKLEDLLGLSPSKALVATSSGTAALFALAGVFAERLQRPPRWVTSAFGFVSTRAGPFANTQFVDCDGRGFLSLDALTDVPSDSYDAVLVTNVFAAQAGFSPYADFCRANGKALLVDNAMALFGVDRASNCAPEEIVSLHHTKPWGFGEGGFAIVSRDHAPLIRNLLWCGKEASPRLSAFGGNGKLSETAAAFILNRLEKHELWAPAYREQWSRIAEIGRRAGLSVLNEPAPEAVTGFVPLLAPHPMSREKAHASSLPIMKYCPPLADLPRARALYDHILCLACHPGMAAIEDDVIARELARLIV